MPSTQQSKWDRRFADATQPNTVAEVLRRNVHLLPVRGRALDLACGLGGNALLLAEAGLQVDAVDLSPVALAKLRDFSSARGPGITTLPRDIEREGLPPGQYQVIVCSHYLHRPLCAAIQSALAPGGLLYYQTFSREKADDIGPGNPDFLLARGELLSLFGQLHPVYYREDSLIGRPNQGLRNVACYIGQKPVNR